MRKISIILPTYNIEKHISKCIESVLNQTYKNIELIIIDDNSSDSTPHILRKYAENDQRIKLILNNKNAGPGAARNLGITKLTGYYTTFMDHDDWQDLNRYEKMVQQLEKDQTDICFSYAIEFYDKSQKYKKMNYPIFENGVTNMQEVQEQLLYSFFPPWAKIYKTALIKELGLKFAENSENCKVYFDDVLFHSLLVLSNINKISIECSYAYFHRFHENSNSHKLFDKKSYMNKEYIEILQQALECKTEINKYTLINYYFKMIDFNLLSIKQIALLLKINRKITFTRMLSTSVIKKLIIQIKINKKVKIIRLFGFYIMKKEYYKNDQ